MAESSQVGSTDLSEIRTGDEGEGECQSNDIENPDLIFSLKKDILSQFFKREFWEDRCYLLIINSDLDYALIQRVPEIPNIEIIKFYNCPNIDAECLRSFVLKLPKLKTILFSQCPRLEGESRETNSSLYKKIEIPGDGSKIIRKIDAIYKESGQIQQHLLRDFVVPTGVHQETAVRSSVRPRMQSFSDHGEYLGVRESSQAEYCPGSSGRTRVSMSVESSSDDKYVGCFLDEKLCRKKASGFVSRSQ